MDNALTATLEPGAAYYLRRLRTYLHTGRLVQEPTACFCGSTESQVVTTQDRYGLPYSLHLCVQCAVLYANPRLTEASTREFYAEHYRQIYDGFADHEKEDVARIANGTALRDWLEDFFDWRPSCVLDIGCHNGTFGAAFREAGIPTYGVEIGESWPPVQPDFVILHHVLEHFRDLETELQRIWTLLPDHGRLYVAVPGLYCWNRDQLFQGAHNWQFTAETLRYVMECCGFDELWLDERITSLWEKHDSRRQKTQVPRGELRRIRQWMRNDPITAPVVRTYNKFPIRARKAYIEEALRRQIPDMDVLVGSLVNQSAVIVAGGPSVEACADEIVRRQQDGAQVFVIERMLHWALERDIMPDYIVVMDASDDVPATLTDLPQTTYLAATQSHPSTWDALNGHRVYLFNTPQRGIHSSELWERYGYDKATLVNAGGSVSLACMSLAMTMGCRILDVYGFDCHVAHGGYAVGIRGVGEQAIVIEVSIDGETIQTTPQYLSFAQQFFYLMEMAQQHSMIERVRVHGDSLVTRMAQHPAPTWLTKEGTA